MYRLGLIFFFLGAVWAQDTIWVRQYDLGSDEQLIGIASQGERVVSVGGYTDPENYDWEALIVWCNQSGDTLRTFRIDLGGDEQLIDVCLDREGNCYVAGNGSPVTRTGWRPADLIRVHPFQEPYCIIAKFDSLGSEKWAMVDSPYIAIGIVVDSSGACYATGAYGTGFLYDCCIARILPEGDTAWTRRFDFNLFEILYRPAIDPDGNLIAPGFTSDFSTSTGIIMKVTPEGDTLWTRIDSSLPYVALISTDVDPQGRVFVTGFCGDDENIDILVVCLDSLGSELWRCTFDFSSDDEGLGIVWDPNGYLYVTGYCDDGDCLLIKLTADGNPIWTERYDFGGYEYLQDVALDDDKNPVACGLTDLSAFPYDLLIAKFSPVTGIAQSEKPAAAGTGFWLVRNGELLFQATVAGRYQIDLYNPCGVKVARFYNQNFTKGENRLYLGQVPAGSYIIRLTQPDGKRIINRALVVR
ncbi:MAG: hypothetical protein ACUVUR_07710 [bacterium]